MLSPDALAAARGQFGITPVNDPLKSRVSSLDSSWGTQTTAPQTAVSTHAVAPRNSLFDTLLHGVKDTAHLAGEAGKMLVAEGLPGITSDKPIPSTWKDAFMEGVANRGTSLNKQLVFDIKDPVNSGLGQTVAGFAGGTAPVKKVATEVAEIAPKAFQGFSDLSTKLLESLKGRTTVSKQFLQEATNQADLRQPERDLFRRVLDDMSAQKTDTSAPFDGVDAFIAERLGGKVSATNKVFSNTDTNPDFIHRLGKGTEISVNGNRLGIHIDEQPNALMLKGIAVEGKGAGIGTRTMTALKEYADRTGKTLFIEDVVNPNFFKQFDWIKKEGQDLLYKPSSPSLPKELDQIHVPTFAEKVKEQLLPLERTQIGERYENITLPDELRGPVANYSEHLYNSPIKTSAGDVHFSNAEYPKENQGYFAHSRIEDLPGENLKEYAQRTGLNSGGGLVPGAKMGGTRRVIELQSDLFQKGRLENENKMIQHTDEAVGGTSKRLDAREAQVAKLEPYRNTWHERTIREEVKQAALDGKTKLQFPTGETAMKIEGLGETSQWYKLGDENPKLLPEDLSVGKEVTQGGNGYTKWVITDVLGDGKFKAVPKDTIMNMEEELAPLGYGSPDDVDFSDKRVQELLGQQYAGTEQFDISGKVDTENPIYKFYEKEVGKYLKNKYNAQLVTDPQGVKWWEVNVKPEDAKKPVLAFGKAPLATIVGGATVGTAATVGQVPNQSVYEKKDTPISANQVKNTQLIQPSPHFSSEIQKVAKQGVDPALVKTLALMESGMATTTANQNSNIGKYAWIVGLTNIAKKDLEQAGVKVDLNTIQGALKASHDFFKLLQKRYPKETPEEIYFNHYYGGKENGKNRRELFRQAMSTYGSP